MAVSHWDWELPHYKFDWLRLILTVVYIFPSRPGTFCGEKVKK